MNGEVLRSRIVNKEDVSVEYVKTLNKRNARFHKVPLKIYDKKARLIQTISY